MNCEKVAGSSPFKKNRTPDPKLGSDHFPLFFASTSQRWEQMVENSWPDFAIGHRRTIKTILMELGSGIEEKTDGTIRFVVQTTADEQGHFKHRCRLYVIPISYLYPLFTVTQMLSMFPVTTTADVLGQPVVSNTEAEFIAVLKQIITSESNRNVVEQLLDAAV